VRRNLLTLATVGAVGACSLDWDALDPRDAPSGSVGVGAEEASSTTAGGASGTGGGEGGATGGAGGFIDIGPWFDPQLSRRRALTVKAVGAELMEFPVLVVLDPARIDYDTAAADGSDLRFEANGALLAHDIDHWKPGSLSTIWVRLPLLGDAPTPFTMYYGGTPSSAPVKPTATWSADYLAVWHLDADGTDATGRGHDGTPQNVNSVPGFVGLAYDFATDKNGRVLIAGSTETSDLFLDGGTVSAIVRARSLGDNTRGRIIDRSSSTTFSGGWGLAVSNQSPNAFTFGHDYTNSFGYWFGPPQSVVFDTWRHYAATADATTQTIGLYVDGAATTVTVSQAGNALPLTNPNLDTTIGARPTGDNRDFDGIIDEVRLSAVERSAAWLDAEARAARDDLLSYGTEETGPPE